MSEETISEEQVLHNKLKFEINQELIHLMNRILELQQENSQLKERIEKAIDYVEENKLNTNKISEMLCGSEIITLLEILKGDKE